jgi:preprotein translocase SecE subunit
MLVKVKNYFLGARQEFKHIQWPTPKVTRHLTIVVIIFSLIIAAYLGIFDYIFTYVLGLVI